MSRKVKGGPGYRLAAKLGFDKYTYNGLNLASISRGNSSTRLYREGTGWRMVHEGQPGPILESLRLCLMWAQIEGWV